MSTTMTLTMPGLPPPSLSAVPCCPKCGTDISLTIPPDTALRDAQRQIDDLQAQVRLLNDKATAAVDRWADYEDELAQLRKELDAQKQKQQQQRKDSTSTTTAATSPQTPPITASVSSPVIAHTTNSPVSSFATAATTRITALLSRKSTPNLKAQNPAHHQSSYSTSNLLPTPPPSGGHQTSYSTSSLFTSTGSNNNKNKPLSLSLSSGRVLSYTPGISPAPSTDDLLDALTREQSMRQAAEGKLDDTSREVEELSVTLFEQANEMVATERRARAQLEERVGELERREAEKIRRLERLESAVGRIGRVRSLLVESKAVTAVDEQE